MSQSNPDSPRRPRVRWLRIGMITICLLPVAALICLYLVSRIEHNSDVAILKARLQAEMQAREFAQSHLHRSMRAVTSPGPSPVVPSFPKKQAQLVRIQLEFEDFETRTADAITVESDPSGSRLMVPSQVFTPMTGKINGRMVTRKASKITIVELGPDTGPAMGVSGGMGMPPSMAPGSAPMGGYMGVSIVPAGVSIVRDYASLGLTELSCSHAILTPVRVLGDFPKAAVGDNLTVVSPSNGAPTPMLTVLGTDETTQYAKDARFEHLLKLTEWTGPVGSMVCNQAGDPVGQILFTVAGQQTYTYAVPMDRIFTAIHNDIQQDNLPASEDPAAVESRNDSQLSPIIGPPPNFAPGQRTNETPSGAPPLAADYSAPADASQPSSPRSQGEMRSYRVQGSAQDVAEAIRSLYGTEAKIAVDRSSRAVLAIASPAVHEQISATIEELNTGARELMAEQAKLAELEKKRQDLTSEQATEQLHQRQEVADQEAAEVESHRKNPKRTRLIKVPGRDPQEVAKLLSSLFGQKADIAVDDRLGGVLIAVNRATSWSEVQFLLAEIEATATRLAAETQVDSTIPGASTEQSRIDPVATSANKGVSIRLPDQASAGQDREVRDLAVLLRAADASEQPALRTKLERQVERQFRQRQLQRKQEIEELSNRIEKLRASQLRREENRTEVIRRRINELLDPNNDLRWDEPQSTTAALSNAQEQLTPKAPPAESMTGNSERTFDGIPYSQWRKTLETERKPAKLIAAMDACGRLVTTADARQVAKEVIQATAFVTSDVDERRQIWTAAIRALQRMPADAVIDEVMASFTSDEWVTRNGSDRTFQGVFLAEDGHPAALSNALTARDQEVVAALTKAIRPLNEDRDWLLAGACRIWGNTDHQLKDFAGLEPLVMQRIDAPPPESTSAFGNNWYLVANALTRKNPETPDLALKLMKHATSEDLFIQISTLVGQMGRHAEPAVPLIIERFLTEWKKIEDEVAASAASRKARVVGTPGHIVAARSIELLGEIGTGKQAAILLKELNLMATNAYESDYAISRVFKEARKAIGKFSDIPTEDAPGILPDRSLICGQWQLHAVNFKEVMEKEAWFSRYFVVWINRKDGRSAPDQQWEESLGRQLELGSTRSPKEIILRETPGSDQPEFIRRGIYELTETTLKIYLAPVGKPTPSEMVKDASEIPEDFVLLELRRSLTVANDDERPEP